MDRYKATAMKNPVAPLLCLLALSACQAEGVPPPPPPAPPAPAAVIQSSSKALSIDPKEMPSCEPMEATVSWDVSDQPNLPSVELWVGGDNDEKLFAGGGPTGSAKTGAWTRPGTRFRLKTPQTRQVIVEALVGGPGCR